MAEEEVTATPTETPASPDPQPTASPAAETPAPVDAAPAPETTDGDGGKEVEPNPEQLLTTLAEHVQERETVKYTEGRKEGASETHSRMQPAIQRLGSTLKDINQGVTDFASDFSEWREDPAADTKGLDRVLTKHKSTFEAMGQVQLERGGWDGWGGFVNNLGLQSKDTGLAQEFLPRLQHMANGDIDDGFWPDLVEHITDAARKEGFEEGRKKGNKETEVRHAAEARANGRKDEAPPAKVAAGAGAGKRTAKDIEKMTATQVAEIPLEELRAIMDSG